MPGCVLWFRRDLRLEDNLALVAAASEGRDGVAAVFVLDDHLRMPSGANRLAFLYRSLRDLNRRLGGRLVVRKGDPANVIPEVAHEVGADRVFCAEDFGPYGRLRDETVERALRPSGRLLCRIGSPYAVEPGTVVKSDGAPYRVFTPFYREWRPRSQAAPAQAPDGVCWFELGGDGVPADPATIALLPAATASAADARLQRFLEGSVAGYAGGRDVPSQDGTSRLSVYLKYGLLHPRQILSRLGHSEGAERFRTELAWREFYADVVWHNPSSSRQSLRPSIRPIRWDEGPQADRRFAAWTAGRTGYPIVDAGMRQLQTEGWMHNRVRMITASFLVKDLHLPWQRGARHFMRLLVDGDLASNNQGWQWVAGSGTDPAPFFRVFNPVSQGRTWDPHGGYIRRYVPELAALGPKEIQMPWLASSGPPHGYPLPIVDHRVEREEALARYAEARRVFDLPAQPRQQKR